MIYVSETRVEGLYLREFKPTVELSPKKMVLFLHGFPGSQKNYDIAEHLALKGYHCAVMHYRGVWRSEGDYSLVKNYGDIETVLQYMEKNGFSKDHLALVGTSWGGFVALEMLSRHPTLYKVILLAPFINLDHDEKKLRMGADFMGSISRPSIRNYSKEQILKDLKEVSVKYNPLDKVSKMDGKKVLIIHGTKDDICPIEHSVRLKSLFKTPARLYQLQEQGHFLSSRELLYESCFRFLSE